MYEEIDISSWYRKETFDFFRNFDFPFFTVTAEVEVGPLHTHCALSGESFFLHSLYASILTCNQIDEFRLRWVDECLRLYEVLHAGCTVLHEDHSFSFAYFPFLADRGSFLEKGKEQLDRHRRSKQLDPRQNAYDMVHHSILPWISFTSFEHAQKKGTDSIPKIVFGKYREEEKAMWMPVSVSVHHALADGFHVGQYYQKLQENLLDF